jgi:hypothetical protein
MANLIRVKQLDQPDLSGFFNSAFIETGITRETFVDKFTDQTISGIKTFANGVDLNGIDNLSLSGVDISVRDANVSITNSDLGTNSANLTVQGSGIFFKGIRIADGQVGTANPAISIYDGPNDDYNKIFWTDSLLGFNNFPSINNQSLYYDFSNDPNGTAQSIAVDSKVVHNTTNETISGIKTFASRPTVNGTGVLLNGEAPNLTTTVYTTGNQIISGIKIFANSGVFSLSGASTILLPNNPLSIVGSGNTYIQVNIQNRATGTNATADLVITANNGNDLSNYIDLGINNSGYNDPNFSNGGAYDGYLFVNGGSLDIGTQTTGTNIEFHIGGTTAIRTIARLTSDGLNIVSGTLTSPNIVYNTGDQTISGVKTFNLQPILSGNPLITGNLSLYSTVTNLVSTGSTLVNTISSLSGSSVLIYGNQNVSGNKTFFDSGTFSLSNTTPSSLPNNPLSIVGSGSSYIQVNIQNRSTGTTATADLVITANNGTDTSNYLDLGINNSGYNDPAFSNGGAYDGYLLVNGGSLDIGTQTTGTNIEFHIGGTTAIRTVARITSDGLNIISGTLNASNILYNTGDQNISGTKNFYTRPTVNGSGVRLFDEPVSPALPNTILYNTGDQNISGIKNFYIRPTVNGSGVRLYDEPVFATLPNTIVYNTGDQTINGVKTFNFQPILSGNPLITGNLSLYATTTNVGTTGSTLLTNISSLSGSSVLIYGNQNVSGAKTFLDSGVFSLSGALPLSLPNNPLSIVGSGNSYLQLNIQNRATGTTASSDLVITANNGTDSANFINLGINNVGYSDPTFNNTTGLDGYLIMDGGDLDIGTRTPGKIIEFHAGGTTEANVIARISQTGLNIVSGNLTVGSTGVLLSGQSNFLLHFISNQATTNTSLSYFGAFAAGYGNVPADRNFPVLENCVARKIVFSTQLASTFDLPFTTGYFINTTTNTTGIIPITTSPAISNTLYNYTANINVPINTGDNVVCLLKTTGQIPTFRSAAQVYCYK